MLGVDELMPRFEAIRRSAFRLELLDRYVVESEQADLARYLCGEPGPSPERKRLWRERLLREREAGIFRHRVHVLSTPLSDYLRFECEWGHALNVDIEDINVIDLAERAAPSELVDHDFWLLDDRDVIRMHYEDRGRFLGGELPDPSELPRYQGARNAALAASEPFADWWARHPEEWRSNQEAARARRS